MGVGVLSGPVQEKWTVTTLPGLLVERLPKKSPSTLRTGPSSRKRSLRTFSSTPSSLWHPDVTRRVRGLPPVGRSIEEFTVGNEDQSWVGQGSLLRSGTFGSSTQCTINRPFLQSTIHQDRVVYSSILINWSSMWVNPFVKLSKIKLQFVYGWDTSS